MEDVLQLLAKQRAENRAEFARKIQTERETQENQQQFTGTVIGKDANNGGLVLVKLDGSATYIPCESTTSGFLKPGQQVLVTLPAGSSKGFIGGMPA